MTIGRLLEVVSTKGGAVAKAFKMLEEVESITVGDRNSN